MDTVIAAASAGESGIRTETVGACGRILLDRPRNLNALNLAMVKSFRVELERFAEDPTVRCVTVSSARSGIFCAGGDVRSIRQARLEGRHSEADAFFEHEFALNARISNYPKPYVALVNGVCLGGGMGLSVHGSHLIVGPRAELGMPETAIGYFPDVGGSYFLNRLAGATGPYLGLTGAKLTPADAVYSGMATAFVAEENFDRLATMMADGAPPDVAIGQCATDCGESRLAACRDEIDRCFAGETISEVIRTLAVTTSEFAVRTAAMLRRASPASLVLTLDLLKRARNLPLVNCLALEYALAVEVTRGAEFAEGVRAMLVDKDRTPRWPSARGHFAAL